MWRDGELYIFSRSLAEFYVNVGFFFLLCRVDVGCTSVVRMIFPVSIFEVKVDMRYLCDVLTL
jgi:hypothetical protein